MTRTPKSERGFTIIELLIVLAITAVAALATARAVKSYFQDRQAQQVADSITVIGKAVASYLSKNAGAIPTVASDVSIATLIADNDLPANFTGAVPWGGAAPYYSVRVLRIPVGSTSQYKALVYTNTAWMVDGKARFDLVGNAARKIGGAGGMTGDPLLPPPAAGAGPAGVNAAWAEPSAGNLPPSTPYLATGGQLFYNVAYSMSTLDAIYLRTDGANQMNAALNMGSHVINAVTDINATGIVNAVTVQAANIGATNSIVSNGVINAAGLVTAGAVNSNGAVNAAGAMNAGGTITGGNINTGGTVTAGAVNASTVAASNTITATNDIRSTNGTVQAKTDVVIDDLATRDGSALITSVKTLTPRLVEMKSYVVDTATGPVHGVVIPMPDCINSGGKDIFIIPNKEGGVTTNGRFGVVARAIPDPANNIWTLSVTDMQFSGPVGTGGVGNPVPSADVPHYGAVIRTFCTY